ncbi:hypothetical protein SPRG_09156 [Saprolegnia parasitica CBS 223.65]|uniref:Uncharacterized protein n=1 Tax=Saprolegnia parasitica (strain CBS 223.65) TaxID=695850 RepID=A0A067C840_SAPPC|nr:hypothetical protein SPRG_09156 [Saprolegnia parasitica CBS 223.65]KDO25330.1 hypothetical protein SPRG_09156 [Saprolegnia parasitica CBS 223.65]|eukprot:XP_012203983.1 hypothetical protein SPRG_09156 [Saprolegnia parasitica CBS 223.65]
MLLRSVSPLLLLQPPLLLRSVSPLLAPLPTVLPPLDLTAEAAAKALYAAALDAVTDTAGTIDDGASLGRVSDAKRARDLAILATVAAEHNFAATAETDSAEATVASSSTAAATVTAAARDAADLRAFVETGRLASTRAEPASSSGAASRSTDTSYDADFPATLGGSAPTSAAGGVYAARAADRAAASRRDAAASGAGAQRNPVLVSTRFALSGSDEAAVMAIHRVRPLTYAETRPYTKHSTQPIVAKLSIHWPDHSTTISDKDLIDSLFSENQSLGLARDLANITKVERHLSASQSVIKLGVTCLESARRLTGAEITLKVRLAAASNSPNQRRTTSLRKFILHAPSQLADFGMEVPGLCLSEADEAKLHDTLAHCERRFVMFSYATVLGSVGTSSDRALFVFSGPSVPTLFKDADGQLVGTLVFKGRRYAMFPTVDVGPRARDSTLNIDVLAGQRLRELNAAAVERSAADSRAAVGARLAGGAAVAGAASSSRETTTGATAARASTRSATVAAARQEAPAAEFVTKKSKAAQRAEKKKSRDASPARAQKLQKSVTGTPVTTVNPFEVLRERWAVNTVFTEAYKTASGASVPTNVRLSVVPLADFPIRDTTDLVISTAKVDALVPKVTSVPLDALLAEFAAADAKLAEERARSVVVLESSTTLPVAEFRTCIQSSKIETICSHLVTQPLRCATTLRRIHDLHPSEFVHLVRMWVLHRMAAAAHGGGPGFVNAFTAILEGVQAKWDALEAMFAAESFTERTTTRTYSDDAGMEHPFSAIQLEMTAAVTELLLMTHAPEFFSSDAAIMALLGTGLGAIATVHSTRLLSTATLMALLHTTTLGAHLRTIAMRWFDDASLFRRAFVHAKGLHDASDLVLSDRKQTMLDLNDVFLIEADLYAEGDVMGGPGDGSHLSVTTINLNTLRDNGHGVAKELRTPTPCFLMQETRLSHAQQLDTFEYHLENEVGLLKSKLFISDHRMHALVPSQSRSSGVASYFHESWPGYDGLRHLADLDVPGRYLVVRTEWDGRPVARRVLPPAAARL